MSEMKQSTKSPSAWRGWVDQLEFDLRQVLGGRPTTLDLMDLLTLVDGFRVLASVVEAMAEDMVRMTHDANAAKDAGLFSAFDHKDDDFNAWLGAYRETHGDDHEKLQKLLFHGFMWLQGFENAE